MPARCAAQQQQRGRNSDQGPSFQHLLQVVSPRGWVETSSSQSGTAPSIPPAGEKGVVGRNEYGSHVEAVSLREVSKETVRAICNLQVAPGQEGFVAPNSVSIAEAHFEPRAWFRAIYAGEEPVGFVMLYDDRDKPEYFLWRLMIAGPFQGKGYGHRAMQLVIDEVRTRPGATELLVSWVPGEGSPEAFYLRLGFEPTGREEHGELEGRLLL